MSPHSHSLASRRLAVDFGMEETITHLLMKHHLRLLGHSACMEHYHWYRISSLVEQHRAGFALLLHTGYCYHLMKAQGSIGVCKHAGM